MRILRWTIGLLLGALLLTSCSAADDSADPGAEWVPARSGQGEGAGADDGGGGGAGGSGEDAGGDADGAGAVRDVISTGTLRIVVDDAREAADEVARIVETAGGRVDERAEHTGEREGEPPTAWLTVRVPSSSLTATLADLETLGEVEDLSIRAQDVTRESQDLEARIRALETSTERLLTLMADAETNADLLAAESALSERQSELESLQSQRSSLSDRVALATLEISLAAEREPAQLEPGGFLGGLTSGWDALVSFASGLLVVLGVMLPWLLVAAAVGAVVLPLVRRRRRRASRDPVGATPRAPATGAGAPSRAPTGQPREPGDDVTRA
ncbi:DUF4349 domain-containing protein [Georgenia wangjunii]|uniref:DUF4349 domain-containing protein n=1 Tax=Georgenia wangjunii TaxID=3117730 RepID=UPI002F26974B